MTHKELNIPGVEMACLQEHGGLKRTVGIIVIWANAQSAER